jgi:hypothetical protein
LAAIAQNTSEIDPKFVKIPRYANQTAITSTITSPTTGMMVYNNATSSIWFYNGTVWANTSSGSLSGSGTNTFIPVFTSSGSIGNSPLFLGGSEVFVNKSLEVNNRVAFKESTTSNYFHATVRTDGMLAFEANGTTANNALVIDDDGDQSVMIGTNAPTVGAKLKVAGNADIDGPTLYFGSFEKFEDVGSYSLAVDGTWSPLLNGQDNLGTSSNRWNTVFAANGTINTSDATLKTNILNSNYGLKEIMQMRPVSFHWKDEYPNQSAKIGFLAQELKEIIPEVVVDKEWVYTKEDRTTGQWQPVANLGVMYSDLIPVTVSAIQEQQKQIQALKDEIEVLKQAIIALKK